MKRSKVLIPHEDIEQGLLFEWTQYQIARFARWGWHGLFIEMKRQRNGHVSEVQKEWISALVEQGYLVRVCHGFDEAKKTLLLYLTGSMKKGVRTDDA